MAIAFLQYGSRFELAALNERRQARLSEPDCEYTRRERRRLVDAADQADEYGHYIYADEYVDRIE